MTAAVVILLIALVALGRRVVLDAERLRLVAEAEHELRGPLQTLMLAIDSPGVELGPELERARTALADLTAARSGRRAEAGAELVQLDRLVWRAAAGADMVARRAGGGVRLDWRVGPVTVRANRGRLAQALGNLLSNAIEHGGGQVRVIGRRTARGIRIEVQDSGRGHGLAIAAKAVRDSGGSLSAMRIGSGTAVALDLPVVERAPAARCSRHADPPVVEREAAVTPSRPADPPAAA